jgi:hypothetical protein
MMIPPYMQPFPMTYGPGLFPGGFMLPSPFDLAPSAFGLPIMQPPPPMPGPPPWAMVVPPLFNRVRARDPVIIEALRILEQTTNLPQDEAYLESIGINIIFHTGREALEVIQRLNASVEFGDTGDPNAHAIWSKEENKMIINQNYRGNMSMPVLYAIAESIYHEAGHAARLGDNQSSIQEELDCLALNTLAYRSHVANDPRYVSATSSGPLRQLFENGVALYPRLFFDPDPHKRALVNRVIEKYGMLPPDSPDHTIPHLPGNAAITERVLFELQRRRSREMLYQYPYLRFNANVKFPIKAG